MVKTNTSSCTIYFSGNSESVKFPNIRYIVLAEGLKYFFTNCSKKGTEYVQSVIETHSDNFNQADGKAGIQSASRRACMPQKNMARWLANHMANRKTLGKMSELFKGLGSHLIRTLLDKEAFLARYSQMTSKCHVSAADVERWIILSETNTLQFKDAKINN